MKKVLLTVTSGVLIALASFNSWARNQAETEDVIASKAGLTKAQAHNALEAFEHQIKTEMAAKRMVVLTDFGTYKPKELNGTHIGRNPRTGAALKIDTWSNVKNPDRVSQADFYSRMSQHSGLSAEESKKAVDAYRDAIQATLKKGGSVALRGEEEFSVGKRAAKVITNVNDGEKMKLPAAKVVKHNVGGDGHYSFSASTKLKNTLNNR
jgi:nucleoid DNA-binding protein